MILSKALSLPWSPLYEGQNVSEQGLREIIRHVVDNGCDGVFIAEARENFFSGTR
jgi:dihydrodipicolinate synthase/N-acetylneuraminate lyase